MSKFLRCSNSLLPTCTRLRRWLLALSDASGEASSSSKAMRESDVSMVTSCKPDASTTARSSCNGMNICMHSGHCTPSGSFGWRSTERQMATDPPGLSTRWASRKAAALSGARQNAPLLMITSKRFPSIRSRSKSATSKDTRSPTPRATARAFAWRTSAAARSTPTTRPLPPAAAAAIKESIPRPEPMSSTQSPSRMRAWRCGHPTPCQL
mmetsp:Transcript_64790/g.193619  ORF Transcript_64790/g.193619 Transcript_64790/m.193619 type:complete len:210 (-) Transcript_64790:703-1332(-)